MIILKNIVLSLLISISSFKMYDSFEPKLVQKNKRNMKWNALTSEKQVDDLVKNSSGKAILLFKHSTRCGISAHVLHNLESDWKQDEANNVTPYMLDLLNYRNVSAHIAQSLGVIHQSPQAILIKDGKVVYSASHHAIKFDKIKKFN